MKNVKNGKLEKGMGFGMGCCYDLYATFVAYRKYLN